ncbi:Uncharacterized protein SCF082_LOCUS34017, partial [Durusdinium trenchii]
ECDEPSPVLFQDEDSEPEVEINDDGLNNGLNLLRTEEDEVEADNPQPQPQLFGDEPDESDVASQPGTDSSAYEGDYDEVDEGYRGARANCRPSQLTASIDSFAMITYNSLAEPLPDRLARSNMVDADDCCQILQNELTQGSMKKWVNGEMPFREVKGKLQQSWRDLANIFQDLLGGTPQSTRAATYLRLLADNALPRTAGLLLLLIASDMGAIEALQQAEYTLVCANLASDYKEAVQFNLRANKVIHMRDQIETGLNLSERLMERRLLISCGDKSASLPAFMKKVFTDCNARFEQADFSCMHHVGFLDWTKFGRLTMAVIDEQARWAAKVLDLNDNYSTVIMICPILAGEGVLHGTRGEHRRIEDKLLSMGLELKNIQVCFDVGTLYKVPRNSDRDVKDQNLFAKSDYWNLLACRATAPLPISEYQTPESGTFLFHEQGRSLTDKEETAQWVASGACIRSILESTMSRVSSLKGQSLVLHHATPYEGTFEKVAYDLMVEHEETTHIACYSELQNPQVFSFVATQVVLEETGSRGAADSDAMTIFDLIVMLEKRGLVDLTLTGHKFERPPAVKRGESEDSMVFNHEAFSVYKPNPVQQKNVKSSNVAGFLQYQTLTKSRMRHFPKEKVLGPAKPLWFLTHTLRMEPKQFYEIARELKGALQRF